MAGQQATISQRITIGGKALPNVNDVVTADNIGGTDKDVTVAKPGVLTVRTDNDTGSLTMETGHGIITGDKIDLYWEGGSRYNMTVGTVAGLVVPIDLGGGDNLPAAASAITAKVVEVENVAVEGDDIQAIGCYAAGQGRVTFRDGSNAVLFTVALAAGQSYAWSVNSGITNPLAGVTVATIALSIRDSAAAKNVIATVIYN